MESFGELGSCADYDGAYRDNIRAFLAERCELEEFGLGSLPRWSLLLEDARGTQVPLFIVEESASAQPQSAHCDHCRCIGWSHHPVSVKRHHFIIPAGADFTNLCQAGDTPMKSRKQCQSCGESAQGGSRVCLSCQLEGRGGGATAAALHAPTHLLHGVLHTNGFGHLLRINGRQKGSRAISGRQLMNLWDNLCSMLRARHVSVEDVSTSGAMTLRLLHTAAFGEGWYGRWGFRFGHGSFGITAAMHAKAVQTLRCLPLEALVDHFEGVDAEVQAIVRRYQRHSTTTTATTISSKDAGAPLASLGDLVRFMLELKDCLPRTPPGGSPSRKGPGGSGLSHSLTFSRSSSLSQSLSHSHTQLHSPPRSGSGSFSTVTAATTSDDAGIIITEPLHADSPSCRWSPKRLELAQQVIVAALKARPQQWVPRHEVREAARQTIGDTGLLDYVLKSLGNRLVCDHVVRRAVNSLTKVLEFSLESVAAACAPAAEAGPAVAVAASGAAIKQEREAEQEPELARADVVRDISYVYKNVLESYKPARTPAASSASSGVREGAGSATAHTVAAVATASRLILDTKHFFKDYRGEMSRRAAANEWAMDDDDMLRILCRVELKDEDKRRNRASPPPELVIVPPHATVGDLKQKASEALQSTYHILRNFQVEHIVDLDDADDDDPLFGSIESNSCIQVQGSGLLRGASEWRYQGGNDSWVVECPCGARDDDGERMIACDVCETWQHTRCGGIADSAAVPHHFMCDVCRLIDTTDLDHA
eukprot:jgi/Mesen1/6569/ME000336S05789